MKKPNPNGEPCQDCHDKTATRIYCSPTNSFLRLCENCNSQREFRDSMQESDTGVIMKLKKAKL
jgi:hypothetical protein